MKKILILLALGVVILGNGSIASAQSLGADIQKQSAAFAGKNGAGLTARDPRVVVGKVIKILLTFTGIIFVSYTVYGGFLIMTANGNDDQISKARSIVTQGTIGIVLILSAYGISFLVYRFILQAQQNPFGTFYGWGVEADKSGFYNNDPLEKHYDIPLDALPDNDKF